MKKRNTAAITVVFMTALITVVTAVSGCSDEVPFSVQENNQMIATENGKIKAAEFKASRYPAYAIDAQGDSTIGPKCAAGDGWASVKLVKPWDWDDTADPWKGPIKIGLKCPTARKSLTCLEDKVFATKKYANQNNSCDPSLPDKLTKFQE